MGNRRTLFRILLVSILPLFPLSISSGGEQPQQQPQPSPASNATFVGSEVCANCHEDIVNGIKRTPHASKAFEIRSSHSCETCHGPGSAHAETGDPSLIRSLKTMKPQESSAVCLGCHENGQRILWKGSVHANRDLSCVTCHSIHHFESDHAQLKTARVDETCSGCHLQIKAEIQKTSHHPIREGLMTCTNCHNPHGTNTPKLISANSVNDQCYTCHTEKRGPFLWEHPPVKENCLNCHNPHGSNNPKLMVAKRPFLCQSCHLDTRHPGTLYDGSPSSLVSNREISRSCSNCHLAIHGSNHPSGATFLR
jgi:DmsE family decaheme c-type cytochrome